MIGFYGIIANEELLDRRKRHAAFSRMSNDIAQDDFHNESVFGKNFSIGISLRAIGENKDLAIQAIEKDFIIAFCGYGKFVGEKKLGWAKEMITRIEPAFREKGENVLAQIEGSFACFVLSDNKLFIVNDRFGSKNLYYFDSKETLVFAPDVGRVVSSGVVPKEQNIEAASQVLISGYFVDDSTLARRVFRFPFATTLVKDITQRSNARTKRYWNVPKTEGYIDEITPELIEAFSSKMEHAIYELADLDERAIVGLSGGLDSRTITCFLAEKQKIKTVTYGFGEESSIAKRVCKSLNIDFKHFSKNQINTQYFKENLKKLIVAQKEHAVVNQYITSPLFRLYFSENNNVVALFDGIYMDVLFSGPYVFPRFEYDDFFRTYGGSDLILEKYSKIRGSDLYDLMENKYQEILKGHDSYDGIGKSQLFYLNGRLRRYVAESPNSKENYCYVFRPGFNYELADFGFELSLRLRKGVLYTKMLSTKFPNVMRVKYKDSYGNRKKTIAEEFMRNYRTLRLQLSSFTKGKMIYFTIPTDYFFLKKNGIDDYRDLFLSHNRIADVFDVSQMLRLLQMVKKKQWLLDLFQKALFLQQFYSRYDF